MCLEGQTIRSEGLLDESSFEISQIRSYNKLSLIGRGSFGKVYLVENENKQKFVMKVLQNPGQVQQEADFLKQLNHEHIVKYEEAYVDHKNRLCLIMEWANNGTLGSYLKARTQPIPEQQIVDWFTQICLALEHVHSHKILHRDIKSENIFLSDGRIKLGDFGISKLIEDSVAKTFIGTPYYISPEIVQNLPYSYKSDIWALGVVLYEMCTLKYPFTGDSIAGLAIKIVKGKFQPISAQMYSQNMKNLIQALLTVDCAKRPNIEQVLQHVLIQNRYKQLKKLQVQQQPQQPAYLKKAPLHKVVIKKEEYVAEKQKREKLEPEEQRKLLREHKRQQKLQNKQTEQSEIIIDYIGKPKEVKQVQISLDSEVTVKKEKTKASSKIKDIPVQIYLPFNQKYMAEDEGNEPKVNDEKLTMKEKVCAQKCSEQNHLVEAPTFDKIERLRYEMEHNIGMERFREIHQIFSEQLEKMSLDELALKYGPNYNELIPEKIIDQELLKVVLPSLVVLIQMELSAEMQMVDQ